ncbi:MAG TPA: tetratricopeptide repeat protein [Candidatus Dormibacteraeota bacterium]|nr:tetratricopeptide repeat protein [Candidatus Dormibacteraeota bacterium]
MVVSSLPAGKRRRLPGLAVRPGSIRQARVEAGLSLAQVASGEVSRTAIFLAETGKTRPTLPTIQLIAARTGKPIEYFLAPDDLAGVALQIDVQRFRDLAITERYDELLAEADKAMAAAATPVDRAYAGFFFAQAQLYRMNPYAAFPQLTKARAAFEDAGDHWMVVECMDLEATGLHLLDDRRALPVAEAALDACRRLRPTNRSLEARILGRLGSIHVAQHRWPKAVEFYSMAVEVAGELKDLSRVGKMYNDLSIAYEHLGDLHRSRAYAQKAITIHELLHDRLAVARAENNLGLVFMRQGDLEEAREHLTRSLDICNEVGVEIGKSHVLHSLAELDLAGGDPDGARRRATEALMLAEHAHEPASIADAREILGEAAEAQGRREFADTEYGTAIAVLRRAKLADRLVTCHVKYARLLERRSDTEGAFEQMKLAMAAARPDLAAPAEKKPAQVETA